ncbi:RNA polymerase subunit sigma [Methanosarcinales archaeon]|nr:MAG: RNA polymerase subunit sigma [Methanosarcinales archaeon]
MSAHDDLIEAAASLILDSKKTVALTGDAIAKGAITSFNADNRLFNKYDPEEYAHIATLQKNPARSWMLLGNTIKVIQKSELDPAYLLLAELEKKGLLATIITNNFDNRHQVAGSRNVIELQGNIMNLSCMNCNEKYSATEVSIEELPPRCKCGGVLRPDAVLFGEKITFEAVVKTREEVENCELMLVIGTGELMQPVASMPLIANENGAKIIEINPEKTILTFISDIFIEGTPSEILGEIVKWIENNTELNV